MSHARIAATLYTDVWCVLPEVHASLCDQFRSHVEAKGGTLEFPERLAVPLAPERQAANDPVGPAFRMRDGSIGYMHPQVEVVNGVALLQVKGVLGKHLDTLSMMCGGYDVALMERQLANIADDKNVKACVLWIDSPGGIAQGTESAANAIRATGDAGKKMIAFSDGYCASAAYWLACACDEFHTEGSAVVGSISTICAGVDSSRAWETAGFERKVFATGELKALGIPGKKWTEAEETFMKEKAASIDGDFKSYVRTRRGLDDSLMNGAFWYAKHAPAGVVDSTAFSNLGQVLEAAMSL